VPLTPGRAEVAALGRYSRASALKRSLQPVTSKVTEILDGLDTASAQIRWLLTAHTTSKQRKQVSCTFNATQRFASCLEHVSSDTSGIEAFVDKMLRLTGAKASLHLMQIRLCCCGTMPHQKTHGARYRWRGYDQPDLASKGCDIASVVQGRGKEDMTTHPIHLTAHGHHPCDL